jgi:hypothetical protein
MGYLSREDILDADDKRYDDIECPEWGGTVRIRSISGRQRDEYEQSLIQQNGRDRQMNLRNARAKLIVLCAVGEDNRPLFTADDLRQLSAKSAKPLDRLFTACQKLVGLSDDDVKSLTENFGATPDDGSTSD